MCHNNNYYYYYVKEGRIEGANINQPHKKLKLNYNFLTKLIYNNFVHMCVTCVVNSATFFLHVLAVCAILNFIHGCVVTS